jgi:hypothetical protein
LFATDRDILPPRSKHKSRVKIKCDFSECPALTRSCSVSGHSTDEASQKAFGRASGFSHQSAEPKRPDALTLVEIKPLVVSL